MRFLVLSLALLALSEEPAAQQLALDQAFGEGGIARLDMGGDYEGGCGLTVLTDGRLVQVGVTNRPAFPGHLGYDIAVVARHSDGALDQGFGVGGAVSFDMDGAAGYNETACGVAEDADGRILVGGWAMPRTVPQDMQRAVVLRLMPNGSLDTSFGTAGYALIDTGPGTDIVMEVFVLHDGKILAAMENESVAAFLAVRLLPDGAIDASYGNGGIARLDVGSDGEPRGYRLDPEGRLLAAGRGLAGSSAVVGRLLSSGVPDPGFGSDGLVVIPMPVPEEPARATGLTAADAGITVVGDRAAGAGVFAARLLPDGTLDPTFGEGGVGTYQLGGPYEFFLSVFTEASGEVIVGGSYFRPAGPGVPPGNRAVVSRLLADGQLDFIYGTPFGWIDHLTQLPNGSVLVNVGTTFPGTPDMVLARFAPLPPVASDPRPTSDSRSIQVLPNPMRGDATIRVTGWSQEYLMLDLFDATGRAVRRLYAGRPVASSIDVRIHVGGLPTGRYLVRASGPGWSAVRPLVVAR